MKYLYILQFSKLYPIIKLGGLAAYYSLKAVRMEAAVFAVGVTVYQGFVSRAVYNLYDTLGQSIQHPVIRSVLEELDIAVHLEVIEALIKEIPNNSSEAVKICLKNIEQVLNKIQELIININNETAYHNTKWFAHWRTCNLDGQLDALKKQKSILDQRIDLLTKVLAVHKGTTNGGSMTVAVGTLEVPPPLVPNQGSKQNTVEFTMM